MWHTRLLQTSHSLWEKCQGCFFIDAWRENIFDIYVTEYGAALAAVLPVLFLYLSAVVVAAGAFEP